MPDKTANWGVPGSGARYRTQDSDPTGGGNFVVAERLDSNGDPVDVLLEWDETAGEWKYGGPVNLDGEDVTNVGALDANSVSTGDLTNVADVIIGPADDPQDATTDISDGDVIVIRGTHTTDTLDFTGFDNLTLDLRGVRLTLDDGGTASGALIDLSDNKNPTVIGGVLDFDIDNNIDDGTPGSQAILRLDHDSNASERGTGIVSGTTFLNAVNGAIFPRGTNNNYLIRGVNVENGGEHSIYAAGFGNKTRIKDSDIQDNGRGAPIKCQAGGSSGVTLTVESCRIDTPDAVIETDSPELITILSCELVAGRLVQIPSGKPRRIIISDSVIDGVGGDAMVNDNGDGLESMSVVNCEINDMPISIGGPNEMINCDFIYSSIAEPIRPTEDLTIKGGTVDLTNGGEFIKMSQDGTTIKDIRIDADGANAIEDLFGANNITIEGVEISNASRGVYAGGSGDGWRITNCVISGSGNGIEFESGYNELIITENDLTGSSGLVDNSGASIISKSDNIGV